MRNIAGKQCFFLYVCTTKKQDTEKHLQMSKNGMKKTVVAALLVGAVVAVAAAGLIMKASSGSPKKAVKVGADLSGEPSVAYEVPRYDVPRRHSQQIEHYAYTVDYNEEWRLPNWVAYSLTAGHTKGPVERYDKFVPDPEVRGATVQFWDYRNSGYDRGHMAPAGDMKWDRRAMEECFYLSNICPQDHTMNEGDWNTLENRVRGWANFFGEVFVVCGPLVSENPDVIGKNCIAVPDSFYKVLLCNMRGEWNAIGFVMPNAAVQMPLSRYCRTVDYVEELTGMDFFHALPDDVEGRVEALFSKENWRIR